LIVVNAGKYFQQKLVVAGRKCLPISSFNERAWAGKLFPMTRKHIEMPWEEKSHGIFFSLGSDRRKLAGRIATQG